MELKTWLYSLSRQELLVVAQDHNVTVHDSDNEDALIDAIVEAIQDESVEGDDD
jgi:hypothetical protein